MGTPKKYPINRTALWGPREKRPKKHSFFGAPENLNERSEARFLGKEEQQTKRRNGQMDI